MQRVIYTSAFNRHLKHSHSTRGIRKVSMSSSKPEDFKGEVYEAIAPDWMDWVKLSKGEISEVDFQRNYYRKLNKLNPNKLSKVLHTNGKITVIYSNESPTSFSARSVLRKWMGENKIEVVELGSNNIPE